MCNADRIVDAKLKITIACYGWSARLLHWMLVLMERSFGLMKCFISNFLCGCEEFLQWIEDLGSGSRISNHAGADLNYKVHRRMSNSRILLCTGSLLVYNKLRVLSNCFRDSAQLTAKLCTLL